MSSPAPASSARAGADWRAALAIVAATTVLRAIVGARVPLLPDETYYWDWSRHLAPGYFDHPPAIAVLIRSGTALLGDTPLGVRAGAILATGVAQALVAAAARRMGGDRAALWAAVIGSCMPLATVGTVLAVPDAPLLLGAAIVVAALERVTAMHERRATTAWWVVAGVGLGVAMLGKYNGVVVALGVLVALLVRPALRRHLLTLGPYLGAAVALAMFAPVITWNASHQFVSFGFQVGHGLGAERSSVIWRELVLLGGQLGVVSPLLWIAMAIAVWRGVRIGSDREAFFSAMATAIVGFYCLTALRRSPEANWPAAAYLPATVVLATSPLVAARPRWIAAACALGAVVCAVVLVHAVHPILPIPVRRDPTAANVGWDSLAAHVQRTRNSLHAGVHTRVAGQKYQDASELAYHLEDHPAVFAVNPGERRNQYEMWPGYPSVANPGDDLVLVTGIGVLPGSHPAVEWLKPHFARSSLHETVEMGREGQTRIERRVWVLEGWRGTWPAE